MKYTQILNMIVSSRIFKSLFIVMISLGTVLSQNFDPISIPFEVNNVNLQNPLIGGLTAPQFVSFDLDGEGAEDMIVFERNGDVLLPFINLSTPGNPSYQYAPEYTSSFPDLIKFVKFIDFNNDGKKDIFALSPKGPAIEVWRNTSSDDNISFEFMKFNFGTGDFLQVPAGGGFTNLYVSAIDIPAIIDVDNDGDLDILTFELGGSQMLYYQNVVKESGLPDDTLVYITEDKCWGNFFESGVDEGISLSEDRDDCALSIKGNNQPNSQRHAGSTVTVFDGDGDNDFDMLLGDISNTGLVYLENDEIDGDAFIINQDLDFPSNSEKANVYIFLGSFFLDIDNDGKRDLIVSANNISGSDNINHIWYYNNIGEDNAPIFDLVQKDFLHETTLRMGHSSHPCFLDYNEDGLMDILVGMNYILSEGQASSISLYLYENVGTLGQPSYKLVDEDYLGLSDNVGEFTGFLAPTAGDLDGDGDTDILIADNRSKLFYFENKAGADLPYSFDGYIYEYKDIRVGSNGKPAIIDLDGDGLSDIVLGEKGNNSDTQGNVGGVNFFKNVGTIGNPDFLEDQSVLPNTDKLGKIFTKTDADFSGESSPCFFYSEGTLMVAVGSTSGNIWVYDDITGNLFEEFNLVTDKLPTLNSGRRTSIAVDDIDNDGFHEIIIGNDNGGLMAFNTTFKKGEPLSSNETALATLEIIPNPVTNYLKANIEGIVSERFSIVNVDGKILKEDLCQKLKNGFNVENLATGIYILILESENGPIVEKFVKY